jgi:hypothetical protein
MYCFSEFSPHASVSIHLILLVLQSSELILRLFALALLRNGDLVFTHNSQQEKQKKASICRMFRALWFFGQYPEARVRFPALPEKKVVVLERGPLSFVSTTEELLDRKVVAPV